MDDVQIDGHGTAMTGIALQFAPDADLVFYETYVSGFYERARLLTP